MRKLKLHFKIRNCELFGISAVTWERVKDQDDSVIKEYLLFYDHLPDFEDFSRLANKKNVFKVTLMKGPLTNRSQRPSNKNKQSLPLKLFNS